MEHISVLLEPALDILNIRDGGIYVDLTLGRAGHSSSILKQIPNGHLYSFDIDDEAIKESTPKLEAIGDNFTIIKSNFAYAKDKLNEIGISEVDGILMDLGVSSPQFDDEERGFSYRFDSPLDMRMDQSQELTAISIVNTYSYQDLKRIFKEYGEDKDSARVAREICKVREDHTIVTTGELVEIIKKAKPAATLRKKGHPAKQIFQALRIEVNGELDSLNKALDELPYLLKDGGVLAIISFHSLEDRPVKRKFKSLTEVEGTRKGPMSLLPDEEPEFVNLARKPIIADEEELSYNHRSTSAKLRAIKRVKNEHTN